MGQEYIYILFIISVVIVCMYSTLCFELYVFLSCMLWASGPEIKLSYLILS